LLLPIVFPAPPSATFPSASTSKIAFSTGSHGAACDLIEAHKWFNLAAVHGDEEASHCRSEVAEDMSAQDIAEAQRRARQWLSASSRKAA
jgi:hypothetical protein